MKNIEEYNSIALYRVLLVKDRSFQFEKQPVSNSLTAARIVKEVIDSAGQNDRENVAMIMLNGKNVIIGTNIVSIGTLNSSTVGIGEVFKPAISANASALVLGHNHPSGDCTPSAQDKILTKRLLIGADIFGMQIHDHVVVTDDPACYFSFADQGLVKEFAMAIKGRLINVLKDPNLLKKK